MTDVAELRYFNRELSWLEFNQRVLEEARDPSIPLLERLKFLAITGSNLDEFTAVRIGSLHWVQAEAHKTAETESAAPDSSWREVLKRTRQFVSDQYACFMNELEPALTIAGLRRMRPQELTERQSRIAESVFQEDLFPVLSPMAIDAEAEFPLLSSLVLHLCVRLSPAAEGEPPRFAVIPFGRQRQRFITLPADSGSAYVLVEDLVLMNLNRFFPGETITEAIPFRITRNADLELREDLAADLLSGLQEVLDARKESACVRLELSREASPAMRRFLQQGLRVSEEVVFDIPGPLDLAAFMRLTDSQGFDSLKYEAWPPVASADVDLAESMFTNIARQDLLLSHPYESFEPVVRLIEEAAEDPDVLAIKQTLYRTSARSPLITALKRAALRGKYVTALVELKARFDEARNIEWAKDLERSGVQVIYGVRGLKTHAKICLVVRREPQGIVRYVHCGTGNYNEQTARVYGDISLMSCDEELGADATSFFHAITGYSQPQRFRKIEAAPIGLRERLLEMIDVEATNRRQNRKAGIWLKLNALIDPTMIEALYMASQVGVRIRLNVRGICCLRPGVPGLSENITVTSVVDRFLEHSRILYFYHGGDERLFISSADWMPRNLDRRVELLIPVDSKAAKDKLMGILKVHLQDTEKAWQLTPAGRYERVHSEPSEKSLRSQAELYRRVCAAVQDAQQLPVSSFEPHRAPGQDA